MARYFNKEVRKVNATLGWEQEYFLIDEALFYKRPDLVFSGRTLLGHTSAKGQQLEDHYFGSIAQRAISFMKELEVECMRLGIPVATRHNEVAPNQFELAPVFEEVNLAVDHNSLLMDFMDRVARRHHFKVLLHEKPFAGVNGSGKHNNWSLATDSGENLLSPGKNPKKNLQFLTFFINTIKAVHDYADLLRACVASLGNDHRLGANEAPPAILSVFVGGHLKKVLEDLEKVTKGKLSPDEKTELKLHIIGKIPSILLDNTDRNRTSPFAFTGNKFEFRAVGASAHCAEPMIVLNTIVAQQLKDFKKKVDQLIEGKKMKKDDAILNVLRESIESSKKIIFEKDGYSPEWTEEAKKRGLNYYTTTPFALESEIRKEHIDLFESNQVLSEREFMARSEVKFQKYVKLINIEIEVMSDMVRNYILPAAFRYQTELTKNVKGLQAVYDNHFESLAKSQMHLISALSARFSKIDELLIGISKEKKKALEHPKISTTAKIFSKETEPLLDKMRAECDAS